MVADQPQDIGRGASDGAIQTGANDGNDTETDAQVFGVLLGVTVLRVSGADWGHLKALIAELILFCL